MCFPWLESLEAGQLHDGQNLVALLEDVDGWEGALASSLVLKPLASGAGFKRSLEVKKGVERVGVCCVHDRTQVWGDFENGNLVAHRDHRFGLRLGTVKT